MIPHAVLKTLELKTEYGLKHGMFYLYIGRIFCSSSIILTVLLSHSELLV